MAAVSYMLLGALAGQAGGRWLCGDAMGLDGSGLCGRFGITVEQLPAWHARMAQKTMFFAVCCRTWAVREVADMVPEHMVPWDDRMIAERMQMAVDAVEDMRVRAVRWWKSGVRKRKLDGDGQQRLDEILKREASAGDTAVQSDPMLASAQLPEVPAPPAALAGRAKLKRFGFGLEDDPDVCAYLLQRFDDLVEVLESSSDRPAAMKMLNDEVTLFFTINQRISWLRSEIRRAPDGKVASLDESKLKDYLDQADKLQKAIEKAKESLGLGEGESGGVALAKGIRNNVSWLIEAHREFYAFDDHARVDHVNTVAELEVLMHPYGDRPEQYRADLPLIAQQVADHLWDEKCDPALPTRQQQRNMRRKLREVCEAMVTENGGVMEDLADEDEAPAAVGVPAPAPVAADGQNAPPAAAWVPAPKEGERVFV